ncbi:EF-hand and coiled-coil domain-containing protein 1 [Pholidichthys leucotaenia]
MERAALVRSRLPRAARRSEWLRGALAHHHRPDPGAENEIVVLATGIDQYLQEVFHHLAYPNRDDAVSAEDFTALCAVLGLTGTEGGPRTTKGPADGEDDDEEVRDVCLGLPSQLSFKDFHSRLCGYFRVRCARGGARECAWRLPVTEDTELVEREIRLRWPRVRRRKCVSFDLSRERGGPPTGTRKDRVEEDGAADEGAALRELVEDLRSALQGSDARCLALEVALRRDRRKRSVLPPLPPYGAAVSTPPTSITLKQGKLVPTHRIKGSTGGEAARRVVRRRDIRDPLIRELKLIRSSRDGQLEEAIRFNRRLEEELQWAYQEVRKLQAVESALRKENAQIRKRAEEAREALSLGLQRVRLIQEQAQSVPQLQTRIAQLEAELHQYRTCCTCCTSASHQLPPEDACSKTDAECLQRAVEGRAASDEEEEDQGMKEVKRRVGGCRDGCQNHAVRHTLSQSQTCNTNFTSRGRCSWNLLNQEQPEGRTGPQKEKPEEEDKTGLQDTEKTRLSLLENKLTDSLTLLLQLRNTVRPRSFGSLTLSASTCPPVGSLETEERVTEVEEGEGSKRNSCLHYQSSKPAATLC